MADILHRVGIRSSVDATYAALTTIPGLAGWWTSNTQGDAGEGGVIRFRFGAGGFDLRVTKLEPGQTVQWEVADGPPEWMGTRMQFDLRQEDAFTIVLFKHLNWKEPVEFMHHCSTKWAIFLMSLKSLVETGTGFPDPRDTKIDNWN